MDRLKENQLRFINMRLGTFIHFNSATFQFYQGDIIDWEYDHENGGKERRYPFLEKDWDPRQLDCSQWARVAKSAGCNFAALTTKHHEGFCLWPSAYTRHCVKNATFSTDVVAAYLEAFRKEKIEAGLYFSILDLTSGIGRKSCSREQKEMIKGQIRELLTNYGEIPFLIVDGWNAPWGGPSYETLPFEELDDLVKSLQPDCLFMNIGCTKEIRGTDILFYENAAGQEVDPDFLGPGVSCNKLTDAWFWREKDPKAALKSAEWVVEKMKEYYPVNVNLMLNLSPNLQGLIDENLAREFAKIGTVAPKTAPLTQVPKEWL